MERPAPLSPDPAVAPGAYGLEELLTEAGAQLGEEISPRTVRLYATQGLLDRPGRDGRSAVYGRRHLLQLVLIRCLARRGLSLAAIAPLCGLGDAELEQQLGQLQGDGGSTGAPPSTAQSERDAALDYLHSLSPPAATRAASVLPMLGAPLTRRAASRWHRFTLAPGIELQINESVAIPPAGPRRLTWLNRLVARLLEQLEDGPP